MYFGIDRLTACPTRNLVCLIFLGPIFVAPFGCSQRDIPTAAKISEPANPVLRSTERHEAPGIVAKPYGKSDEPVLAESQVPSVDQSKGLAKNLPSTSFDAALPKKKSQWEETLAPVSIQPADSNLAVVTPEPVKFEEPSENPSELSLTSSPIQQKVASPPTEERLITADRASAPRAGSPDSVADAVKPSSRILATEDEKHQKIAEGWQKPWAVLFLTGQQMGYIEPCGCTGLENQKGGLNRRDTLMTELRARDYTVIPLDLGNQERRIGQQGHLKFIKSVEAMKQMDYRSIALGPEDLKLSPVDLLYTMTDVQKSHSPFVSSNVRLFQSYPDEYKIVEVGSRKIGIASFLGKTQNKIENGDIKIADPVESLQSVVPKLKSAGCEYLVLLAQASIEESIAVAKAVPEFDLVVTAGGIGEPTYRPESIDGTKSLMVQVGVKGMYVGIVGLFEDKNTPPRYQRIALSSQFSDSPRMMELFGKYQESLEQIGFDGLGLRSKSHPSTREFVGTEKCGECHTKALAVWNDSPHARATESIVSPPSRSEVARHFDPECVSCHVTGWNPQEYYPYHSGYQSLEATPQLVGSGCENCHGPGSAHVAAESGDMPTDDELIAKLRDEMRLPMSRAEDKCLECHDMDNSPEFHDEGAFQKYWDQIKHYGKD